MTGEEFWPMRDYIPFALGLTGLLIYMAWIALREDD